METKLLIKIKVSKSKLYEAKVGVVELQRKWDQRGSGTRMQARFKKTMNAKMKLLKNKWISYDKKATDYNDSYADNVQMATPDFEEVKSMTLNDHFWNSGSITHPEEPWATDSNVQKGIEAYRLVSHCQDELHRILREARQAVKWAVKTGLELDSMLKLLRDEFENQEELREEGLLEQEELQFLDAQQDDLIDLTMNNND
ncbi:uncharacterized protein PGTG_21898 [Puccinia graminis f. sp. tritici CRL 75-36-700-3]|uniref:Uncharacterized protein n=1 Tax=Puccinia graminis f. sp. tritici (strain CRL 75-36-700-3 / race SCCL) TaxID=418459 RepID=H6QTC9_PUCGT|nr:uncharacterized protein PGTG_21898 [Puccinia graminis f. sp. tritici CRL 75-36-700-3]EHS64148.1 hypothetical protein PGTG_21898 [Puccinia graminis f. sp. tritici CRL 75-36-700-3]